MLRNEEAGRCVYYGYTQTREGWDRLMTYMNGAVNTSSARLPRICIEAHASQASAEFVSRRVPDLLRLRKRFKELGVPLRVVLTVRVREPLSYYISFYRWRVAGLQRGGGVIRLSARKSVVQPIGSTFLEWAPPNLQSVGLLHGDVELFAGLKAGGWPGVRSSTRRPHPYWTAHQSFGESDYTLVRGRSTRHAWPQPHERGAAAARTIDPHARRRCTPPPPPPPPPPLHAATARRHAEHVPRAIV
jgi:hypothetical protein